MYPDSPSSVQVTVNSNDFKTEGQAPLNPRSKQSVSFFARTEVFEVPHYEEFSQDECQRIWYSANDMDTFTQEAFDTARRIARQTPRRDDVARGLESKSLQGFEETNVRRMRALWVVRAEQQRQYQMGMYDDLLISQLYFDNSEEARIQALDRAAIDELEASMYQRESAYEGNTEDVDDDLFGCCFFAHLQWFKGSNRENAFKIL